MVMPDCIHLAFQMANIYLAMFIVPVSVSEPMRIILNQSEKSFVSRLTKNGKKSIRTSPI